MEKNFVIGWFLLLVTLLILFFFLRRKKYAIQTKNETINPIDTSDKQSKGEIAKTKENKMKKSKTEVNIEKEKPKEEIKNTTPEENIEKEKSKPIILTETQTDDDEEDELTYNELLDKFCNYIQKNKLVNIEGLSNHFKESKEDTVKRLREMEKEGQMIGFLDSNGEYFYLTIKEIELLENLFTGIKRKKFSKREIERLFNEIMKEELDDLFLI